MAWQHKGRNCELVYELLGFASLALSLCSLVSEPIATEVAITINLAVLEIDPIGVHLLAVLAMKCLQWIALQVGFQ